MRKLLIFIALVAANREPVLKAVTVQDRRANISGSRGDGGKCTIEVEVDDVADVEISGDQGRIRTLQGGPSVWRRFQCSSPLPRNPGDFRFKGIDGRGRVELIRDPRNNGGVAVVRIEDKQSGREGYTFDLEWRGGSGYFPGDGRDDRGDRGGGRFAMAEAIKVCKDAVRDKARDRYGLRNVDFLDVVPDNNPGRDDYVNGSFEGRRGDRIDQFSFSCSVDFRSGRVRSADIRRR